MGEGSELLDFLVWMYRKHKEENTIVSVQFIQALGVYAIDYWKEKDELDA